MSRFTTPTSTPEDRRVWLIVGLMLLVIVTGVPLSSLLFGINYTYTLRVVALGGALLGIVTGVVGSFAVLRQQSLMGDALSHAALPGVAIAFLLAGREPGALLIGAGLASWIGVQVISAITRTTRLKQDTAMGIVLVSWFALGLALLALIQNRPDASQAGLDRFIFGQAAAMVERDVWLIAGVGLGLFAVIGIFWKEFKLLAFDPEFAGANGFPVRWLDTLLSTLVVVAIVLGLQLAGVILMVGMLIAPGVAARQWTHKLHQMVLLAAVFGAFAGGAGATLSAVEVGLPTGPLIIVVASVVVLISLALAPGRGLVWTLLQQRDDRRRFATQNVLRDLYRYALGHGDDPCYGAPEEFLVGLRGATAKLGLAQLARNGLIERCERGWRLTLAGVNEVTTGAFAAHLAEASPEPDLEQPEL